jgi:hypothetical protein
VEGRKEGRKRGREEGRREGERISVTYHSQWLCQLLEANYDISYASDKLLRDLLNREKKLVDTFVPRFCEYPPKRCEKI